MSDSTSTVLTRDGGDSPRRRRRGPIALLVDRYRRIVTFVRQVVAELRKVIWPTRKELITYTTVVLAFVAFMVVVVSIYDFAFGQAVLKVFGSGSDE